MNPNGMCVWVDLDYKNEAFETVTMAIKRKYDLIY